MPSTYEECVLDLFGTTMGRLGEARLNTTQSATTHGLSPIVRSARIAGYADPMGDCGSWGGAGEELLCVTLDGTAGAGPTGAAAEANRHNVTKPHRPRTYRDAGREWASGAAGRSTRQAGASTSRRH